MMKNKLKLNSGFTLVETLIAISILVMAVTGAFAAAHNGITSSMYSKDQIIAFYLAQEGVEHIRNLRDRNALEAPPDPWLEGIAMSGDPCELGSPCRVDAVNNTIVDCGASCPPLRINTANGFYGYDSGTDTQYTRTIILTAVNNNEVVINSTVTWARGLIDREFTATEHIFNWQ